ncbi:hypothetical protein D9619_012020 [Psilocybe cf. subviscida]|uniref:BTB domain-containing protein n=1 Tax=Psilocybe cf. subviscida TaxID=2480587 RepID=A0A8H5EZ97_9AGAR|nr:hypothetical protein D9619_012020 [Psilocybe cf. subviscida]
MPAVLPPPPLGSPPRPPRRRRDSIDDAMAIAAMLDVEKSTRFWFAAGTVVIQAENVQFRIHWDILATRSTVFKDLFELPQAANETYVEGCPLVIVQDAAEDWVIFLEVLYYSSPVGAFERDLAFYASLVRLGRKYAFADFAEASLKHLQTTLQNVSIHRSVKMTKGLTPASLYKLASVAEELGIQVLLPPLYFSVLSSLNLLEISDGLTVEGASALTFPPQFRRMVIRNRDRFNHELRASCRWLLHPVAPSVIPVAACTSRAECSASLEKKRNAIIQDDIYTHLEKLHEFPGMCPECASRASSQVSSQFSDFYNHNLLSIFDLRIPLATFTD